MPHIRGTIEIARPIEVVFDVVADQTTEPSFNPQMVRSERVTPGPVGEGSRFRATAWSAGREVPMTIELVDYGRPYHLGVLTSVDGTIIDGTIDFAPCAGGGTRMTWDWEVRTLGRVRLLAPLVGWLGGRQERRVWSGLKRHLEAQVVPPAGV
jgi:polyketide cyclase/dehydrase/lipid transport protein